MTALVNGSGTVVERFGYDAFGVRTVYDANYNVRTSGSSYDYQHGFQGRPYDAISGTNNFRNREVSPALGRPIQVDMLRFRAGDVNFYRWEGNNPTGRLDPSGNDVFDWLARRVNPRETERGNLLDRQIAIIQGKPIPTLYPGILNYIPVLRVYVQLVYAVAGTNVQEYASAAPSRAACQANQEIAEQACRNRIRELSIMFSSSLYGHLLGGQIIWGAVSAGAIGVGAATIAAGGAGVPAVLVGGALAIEEIVDISIMLQHGAEIATTASHAETLFCDCSRR